MDLQILRKLPDGSIMQIIGSKYELIVNRQKLVDLFIKDMGHNDDNQNDDYVEWLLTKTLPDLESEDLKLWLIATTSDLQVKLEISLAKANGFTPLVWDWCLCAYYPPKDCEC